MGIIKEVKGVVEFMRITSLEVMEIVVVLVVVMVIVWVVRL